MSSLAQSLTTEKQLIKVRVVGGGGCKGQTPLLALAGAGAGAFQELVNCFVESFIFLKVFAMLASLECLVPIIGSAIFTNLYNATSEFSYPWVGSYYFASSGVVFLGEILTF